MCEVETGEATRTIVCGAPNVAAGQTVPVALPGAVLPGGRKLGRAELRGVTSDGMILSEAELQIGDDADGIAVLDGETGPGQPRWPTSCRWRSRCWSSRSTRTASTASASTEWRGRCMRSAARRWPSRPGRATPRPPARARRPTTRRSPWRFRSCVRASRHVCSPRSTIGPSPLWLKARLVAAGQRPINNVVDITNYVMLLTAQPLHAFDLDRVPDGALIVRTAADGEKLTTLDGVERTFDAESVLVCDRNGPSGIAGIMGGQISEVSELDHPRPARGRHLERGEHPAHLANAGVALGGVQPVREAASPRAGDPRPAHRFEADRRDVRGEARARDDRRRRRAAARAPSPAAPAPCRLAARDADRARAVRDATWSGSASGSSARATT